MCVCVCVCVCACLSVCYHIFGDIHPFFTTIGISFAWHALNFNKRDFSKNLCSKVMVLLQRSA